MSGFLFLSFLIFLLLIDLAVLAAILFRILSLSFTDAPYIQIPEEVLPEIFKALQLKDGSTLYDLGCGDGRVLLACHQEVPKAKYIGVDNATFPIFVARRNVKMAEPPASSIKIIKENFFQTDLSAATQVFLYLYPGLMNKLLPKLERELRPGARVVSCDYKFTNKEPSEIVNLHRSPGQLGKFLYVYIF